MENKLRIQDDLYEAINGETLANLEIPADRPVAGGFSELDQNVEKILMNDFSAFAKGEKSTDIESVKDAILLYKKVLDTERRNKDGIKPALKLLNKIKAIKSIEDLNNNLDLAFEGLDLPVNIFVSEDMGDATKHSMCMVGPSIILPDTVYYKNEQGEALLNFYKQMVTQLISYTDLSDEEKVQYVEDTLKFDRLVSDRVKSRVEWADYVKCYNPMPTEEVAKLVKPLDLNKILNGYYKENAPKVVVVYDPRCIKEFGLYFNEKKFSEYIHWAYVKALVSACGYLSTELKEISGSYRRALTGVAQDPVIEKQAYRLASQIYSDPIGVYYGRTYFGEEAKADVVSIVKKIIETYKVRVKKNTFLEEKTKEKAILKLSTIEIKMGYPDSIPEYYNNLKLTEEESLFEAMNKISLFEIKRNLDKLNKKVDRTEWAMPGHMVNACYNPSANDITFPAAILQKPFYSIKQTISQNLGGIGAVIGHEISHAFDNNGAHFDENGNLSNWWSEKDLEAFQALTKDMIAQWDGIEFHGGKVNGELVVSENIADNGGMAVTIEIMHNTEGANFKEYFENWARVWCQKAREEYIKLLLASDVHSPAKLRANIQPRNFKEWYEAFDVKETDQMFIPEDKRIIIW